MKITKTVKASEFKAKCLGLMDEVASTGEEIIVTKNGKPITRLVPYKKIPETLVGLHKGQWTLNDDLVEPLNENWEAEN